MALIDLLMIAANWDLVQNVVILLHVLKAFRVLYVLALWGIFCSPVFKLEKQKDVCQ